eukprot:3339543-Pyramimonas_sp.AAC.1
MEAARRPRTGTPVSCRKGSALTRGTGRAIICAATSAKARLQGRARSWCQQPRNYSRQTCC